MSPRLARTSSREALLASVSTTLQSRPLYVLGVFLVSLIGAALVLHYGFAFAGALPDPGDARSIIDREHRKADYTLWLNLGFLAMSAAFWLWKKKASHAHEHDMGSPSLSDRVLFWIAIAAYVWLGGAGWSNDGALSDETRFLASRTFWFTRLLNLMEGAARLPRKELWWCVVSGLFFHFSFPCLPYSVSWSVL